MFEGARIDSFEAEILGTLDAGRTGGVMIVARATSERVIRSGVAQGMSGSPVFVGGRLIGALSSGFSFSREPIFGITPIGEMLEVLERADATRDGDPSTGLGGVESSGLSSPPGWRGMRWAGDATAETVGPHAPSAPSLYGAPTRLALPLACGGLNPGAADVARDWLAPLGLLAVPGGQAGASTAAPQPLEPGSAVAIDVLRGDLLLSAIGTVTWRDGDRVLLFGHPLFQSGDAHMPLATATITTVVPSAQISFKLGARGQEVGATLQDRRAGVSGRIGAHAHMMPFRVTVEGVSPHTQRFRFETVDDRILAPSLIGIAALNSFLEAGGTGAGQTVRWTMRLHRHAAPALRLDDVVASDSPTADVAMGLATPLRFLFGNPFERLRLDSLDIAIDTSPRRQAWTLRAARLVEPTVRARGRLHVNCELEAWRGGVDHRTLVVTVPGEVPDGKYTLWIGGGSEWSHFEASRLPGRYRPGSLDEAWRRLANARREDAVYAALFARAPEVTADGRDYPELPVFALSLMASDQSATDLARRGELAWLDEAHVTLPGVVRGELLLNVVVDSHGSLAQP